MQMVTVKLCSIVRVMVAKAAPRVHQTAVSCRWLGSRITDERAAAATDTFDVPDPGFLPRDLHADSDESNIVDWDALSTTDDAEESDSRRKPFIDDEAIEEADRVDDEANDDEDGYDDVDDCGGGGDEDDDDHGVGDDEQAEENDLKLSSSFPRSKRRRLTTTLLDSD